MGIEKNTVSAKGQVTEYDLVRFDGKPGGLKVLFLGNSITRHAPAPEIGWAFDWGMAASAEEKDYVHVAVHLLEAQFGAVEYATVCLADWERSYSDDTILERYRTAREFGADLIFCRWGENVYTVRKKLAKVALAPHLDRMIKYFRREKTRVVISDLFWENEAINAAIYRVAADNGYTLVKLGDLGAREENKATNGSFWHRGVSIHPNDLGMRRIAERLVAAI